MRSPLLNLHRQSKNYGVHWTLVTGFSGDQRDSKGGQTLMLRGSANPAIRDCGRREGRRTPAVSTIVLRDFLRNSSNSSKEDRLRAALERFCCLGKEGMSTPRARPFGFLPTFGRRNSLLGREARKAFSAQPREGFVNYHSYALNKTRSRASQKKNSPHITDSSTPSPLCTW